MLRPLYEIKGAPLRGGAVTVRERPLLEPGQFSMVQNLRAKHPGFEKRKGYRKLHSTNDGTNKVISLYQYKKTRITEDHVLAQMSDGVILDATNIPPTVTTGVFGAEIASLTSASMIPACWHNLNDILIYSHGSDQHQMWTGDSHYPDKVIALYNLGSNPTATTGVYEMGFDYTDQATDGDANTVVVLDSLDTAANGDCLLICTSIPASSFTFTVSAGNDTASIMSMYYWKNDSTWAAVSGEDDGTDVDGDTLKQSGTVTFTQPTDMQEKWLYNRVGYWYMFVFSAALDAEVEISSITYDSDWADMVHMWNGVTQAAVEVMVEGTTQFETYGSASVDLDTLTAGKKIVIASTDPIEGIYWDVGDIPNATGTALTSLKYWDGDSWVTVGSVSDGTSGLSNTGWMIFPRQAAVQPLQFESTQYYAYWYEVIFDSNLAANMIAAIDVMPYFNIEDMGKKGQCSCAWKERACITFSDKLGEYVYISAANAPQVFQGADFGIVEVGDGRPHKVTAMVRFYNDLMVFQEEKGSIGGCITLIQGYSPPTFGKFVLSTKLGTFSQKSVDVVENVYYATATTEKVATVAFFLSRYGVCMTDGNMISIISDDVQNYFDPRQAECIRRGYEKDCWLKHDPIDHVLRIGLVSGSTATTPNIFLVYDLVDRVWYFDDYYYEFSCMENVDAGSGNVPVVSIAGGVDDGYVYQLNYGLVDVDQDIDSYITVELTSGGQYLELQWLMLQAKAQTGTITLTTYVNGISKDTISLDTAAEVVTQLVRRHYLSLNVHDPLVSLKFQDDETAGATYFEVLGMGVMTWSDR